MRLVCKVTVEDGEGVLCDLPITYNACMAGALIEGLIVSYNHHVTVVADAQCCDTGADQLREIERAIALFNQEEYLH